MSDFWDEMQVAFTVESAIDDHLQERKLGDSRTTSMRDLTDKAREAHALPLPLPAGVRVQFAYNLGAVLTYDDIPDKGVEGTLVTVRTGSGDATSLDGNVFVLWDDGKFRSVRAEHLRLAASSKKASSVRMRVADLGDLTSFFSVVSGREDELVHRATKDLWSFKKDGESYVIERLFKEDGNPLKV